MITARPKTKVVIRNLPPGMTEETFMTVLDNLTGGHYTWLSYFPGKVRLKRVVFSRAYINFSTSEDVFDFKQRFDGHVFIGQKGHQYRCSVEYAPLQKVPVLEEKPHPLEGTIEKDAEYLAFWEAYESGQAFPSTAAPSTTAAEMPSAAASSNADGGEGKVVMSRLMEFLVRKYTEGGNRLGGMRAASKAKQSKQDLIQQVQVSAQEARGTSGGKAAKVAAAAAAAAATAAITAAATADTTVAAKGSRRERDRSAKGAPAEVVNPKQAERQSAASRGATGKGARSSTVEASLEAAAPAITLLTRATASKGQCKEPAPEKSSGRSGGGGRSDAQYSQQTGSRVSGTEVETGAALAQEGGKARNGVAGRGTAAQQGAARGAVAHEGTPLVVRPVSTSTPRLLLIKGGDARQTQEVSSSGQPGPAQSTTAAPVTPVATAKKSVQEQQGARQQPQQQQQQSQARGSKQPSTSTQQRQEDTNRAARGAAAPVATQHVKPSKAQAPASAAANRSSSKASTASSTAAIATAAGSKGTAEAPAVTTAIVSTGSVPEPTDAPAAEDGLAATASAAATAALTAATARPSGKKVRAGFQMYVPGSLRGRAPGGTTGTGGGPEGGSSATG
ncbi:hypothetical protein VaNZ11_015095 [Volvox africanus]|uniref:UPF3 domain-containing protein n=1 Tax=Volvox africanus TaxID=51714 RepID=A0ABQ5SLF8_9CHLO|nr:hypothetical protein VaNZ11_015095 [Volvox africanus]